MCLKVQIKEQCLQRSTCLPVNWPSRQVQSAPIIRHSVNYKSNTSFDKLPLLQHYWFLLMCVSDSRYDNSPSISSPLMPCPANLMPRCCYTVRTKSTSEPLVNRPTISSLVLAPTRTFKLLPFVTTLQCLS